MTAAVRHRLTIGFIVALAATLRLTVATIPSMAHPDEVLQYLEQAHRLVFGYGVVPWEYRYGMRSWLVPLVLSPFMRLGTLVDPGGSLYLLLPRYAAALLSLLVLPAAYSLGSRLSQRHAIAALAVAAFWYEFVYFGGHLLTESLAVSLILPAAALLLRPDLSSKRLLVAGFLLGLGIVLRFHYAPAAAVLVLMTCKADLRRWAPLLGGGLAALALSAGVDLAMRQTPFGWIAVNVTQNIVNDRAATFGTSGPLDYVSMYFRAWGPWLVPLLLCMAPVISRYRPLFWMAVTNLLVHSAIGHKEYRFVLLTTAIFLILAAIGSVEWLNRLEGRLKRPLRFAPAALVLLWLTASTARAYSPEIRPRWTAFSASFRSAAAVGREDRLCGVAMIGFPYWQAGGYAYLHRPVPIYLPEIRDLARSSPAFDAILAAERTKLPPSYVQQECEHVSTSGLHNDRRHGPRNVCIFKRPGPCNEAAAPDLRLETILLRMDQ